MQDRFATSHLVVGLHFLSIDDKNAYSFRSPTNLTSHLSRFHNRFPDKIFEFVELDVGMHVIPVLHDVQQQRAVDCTLLYNTIDVEDVLHKAFPDLDTHGTLYTYPKLFSHHLAGSKLFFVNRSNQCASPEIVRLKSYNMALERSAKTPNCVR
jgi:hypothetical protein